jgi:hypothetical protein
MVHSFSFSPLHCDLFDLFICRSSYFKSNKRKSRRKNSKNKRKFPKYYKKDNYKGPNWHYTP